MLCQDIHGGECATELDDDWKFCPHCGRKTGSVEIDASLSLLWPSPPVPLRHKGHAAVHTKFRLPEGSPLSVKSAPAEVSARASAALHLNLARASEHSYQTQFGYDLEVMTDDGPPTDIWKPQSRERTRTVEIKIEIASPAQLSVEQEIAIFHPKARERVIRVHNTGGEPLELEPFVFPYGFDSPPSDAGNKWTIAPGLFRDYPIRCVPGAPEGKTTLRVSTRDARQVHDVILLKLPEERIEVLTDYVVGIDFGTSGTSVFVRRGLIPNAEATALKDKYGANRFPTAIYVQLEGGREKNFYIGTEAIEQGVNPDPSRGFLVRELKSLLRGRVEPYEGYGKQYIVDNLLKRYLEKLKKDVINVAIERDGVKPTVAWNFSLPVLDSHRGGSRELFELQRSRMEKAVRAAGYLPPASPGCTFATFSEPFCAAVYLLQGHGRYRFSADKARWQDGDWACVFDSGGGTTDVVLGQLRLEDGRLQFDEVTTLGGYRSGEDSMSIATFGGAALTRGLALTLTRQFEYLRRTLKRPDELKYLPELEEETNIGVIEWDRKNPNLLRGVEQLKIKLAPVPDKKKKVHVFPDSDDAEEKRIAITREEFDTKVVDVTFEPVLDEMDRSVFQSSTGEVPLPSDVRWVFPVGGNTRVRRITDEWLPGYFTSGIEDLEPDSGEDEDRMLAVGGGTVWANEARRRNAIPYAVWVEDQSGVQVFAVYANDTFNDKTQFPAAARSIPVGQSMTFTVIAEANGHRARVGWFRVTNNDHSTDEPKAISTFFRFQGRKLLIESDETGSRQTKQEYMV